MKDDGVFLFDFHSRTRFAAMTEFSAWEYYDKTGFYSEGPHLLLEVWEGTLRNVVKKTVNP